MKKQFTYSVFLALCILLANNALALNNNLPDFRALAKALEQGYDVKAIIDVTQCKTKSKDYIPGSTSINFDTFSHYAIEKEGISVDSVSTSLNRLSTHPQFGLTRIYIKLQAFADNEVVLNIDFLEPQTFNIIQSLEWLCPFNKVSFKKRL